MKRPAPTAALCTLSALLGLGACKSLDEGAREAFSKDFSCPEARIDVKPRPDLDAYDLTFGGMATPAPPADVKADPERYALWQKQHRDTRASWNNRITVFEARGCNHDALYTCSHPNGSKGGANYARASCSKAASPPTAPKK